MDPRPEQFNGSLQGIYINWESWWAWDLILQDLTWNILKHHQQTTSGGLIELDVFRQKLMAIGRFGIGCSAQLQGWEISMDQLEKPWSYLNELVGAHVMVLASETFTFGHGSLRFGGHSIKNRIPRRSNRNKNQKRWTRRRLPYDNIGKPIIAKLFFGALSFSTKPSLCARFMEMYVHT